MNAVQENAAQLLAEQAIIDELRKQVRHGSNHPLAALKFDLKEAVEAEILKQKERAKDEKMRSWRPSTKCPPGDAKKNNPDRKEFNFLEQRPQLPRELGEIREE